MKALKQSSIYTPNVGNGDRLIRYFTGGALLGLFMVYTAASNRYDELLATLALVSIVVISTAIIRWDPLYALLRINTVARTWKKSRKFMANVGVTDRIVRLAIGSAMISGFAMFSPTPVGWTAILPLLAIPVIVTAITGWCPIYSVTRVSTASRRHKAKVLRPTFSGPSTRPSAPRTKNAKAA